jgi:hypothetical protein
MRDVLLCLSYVSRNLYTISNGTRLELEFGQVYDHEAEEILSVYLVGYLSYRVG